MTVVATIIHRVAERRARASARADFHAIDERSWADIGARRHQIERVALAKRSRTLNVVVFRGNTNRITGLRNRRK